MPPQESTELVDAWNQALTTSDVQEQTRLRATGHPTIILALAKNPHLDELLQEDLAKEEEVAVDLVLARRERLCPAAQRTLALLSDTSVLEVLAKREDLAEDVQLQLVTYDWTPARAALAGNRKISLAALVAFLQPQRMHPSVLTALTLNDTPTWQHPGMPAKLLWDWDPLYVQGAAEGCDVEAVLSLAPTWNGTLGTLLEATQLVNR